MIWPKPSFRHVTASAKSSPTRCRAPRQRARARPSSSSASRSPAEESSLLSGLRDDLAALAKLLAQPDLAVSEADVLYALDHGWWDASKQLLRNMRARGDAVGTMEQVRARASQIRDQSTEIINLMRVEGREQGGDDGELRVPVGAAPELHLPQRQAAGRIDGPVTVLNVDNENVTLTNESFHFSALGRQKPKTFQLHLQLDRAIVPENSTWAFASVGRISFTLAKAEAGAWPRLLSKNATKPKNMHTWYERQQSLDAQVKREKKEREEREEKEREEKEKKEKAAEAKAKKAAAPPPSPPADGGDADGGDAPPAPPVDSEEGGAPTPPSEGKKKKKARRRKQRRMRSRIGEMRAKFVDESLAYTHESCREAHALSVSSALAQSLTSASRRPDGRRTWRRNGPCPSRRPFAVDFAFAFDAPPRARVGLPGLTTAPIFCTICAGMANSCFSSASKASFRSLSTLAAATAKRRSGRAFGFGMGTLAAGARFGKVGAGRGPSSPGRRTAGVLVPLRKMYVRSDETLSGVEVGVAAFFGFETGTRPSLLLLAFLACRRTGWPT